eukprot:g2586.t1
MGKQVKQKSGPAAAAHTAAASTSRPKARPVKGKAATIVRACEAIQASERLGYGANLAHVAFLLKRREVIDTIREMRWAQHGLFELGALLAALLALLVDFEREQARLDRSTALAEDIGAALVGVREKVHVLVEDDLLNAGQAALALGPVCPHAAALWCDEMRNTPAAPSTRLAAALTGLLERGEMLRHPPHRRLGLRPSTVQRTAAIAIAQMRAREETRTMLQQAQKKKEEEDEARARQQRARREKGKWQQRTQWADKKARVGNATAGAEGGHGGRSGAAAGPELREDVDLIPWQAFRAWLRPSAAEAAAHAAADANTLALNPAPEPLEGEKEGRGADERPFRVPQPLIGPFRARLVACVAQANPVFGALRELFLATAGARWAENEGWLADEDVRKWHGVQTLPAAAAAEPEAAPVVALALASNNLCGSLPPSLHALTDLRRIDLSRNRLCGALPATLGALHHLSVLNLRSKRFATGENRICGALPPELGRCAALEVLDLRANHIAGVLPPQLGACTALRQLLLQDNALSGEMPGALFAGCARALRLVLLDENRLSGQIPTEVGRCQLLEHLDLSVNRLRGTLPASLGGMPRLRHLDVRWNQLSGAIPPELGDACELRRLIAGRNRISGALPVALGRLKKLQVLQLEHNKLSGCVPPELAAADSLEVLGLAHNQLCGPLPRALAAMSTLREMWLQGNEGLDGAPAFAQRVRHEQNARCAVRVDSDRWVLAANPAFDLRTARLQPSPENTETMVVRVLRERERNARALHGAIQEGASAGAEEQAHMLRVRRFVEDARVPPKHFVPLRCGAYASAVAASPSSSSSLAHAHAHAHARAGSSEPAPAPMSAPARSTSPPPGGGGEGEMLLDPQHAIRLLRDVQWVPELQCWRVGDELPAGALEEEANAKQASASRGLSHAVEWLSRRPLAAPPDNEAARAFQSTLRFAYTDEGVAKVGDGGSDDDADGQATGGGGGIVAAGAASAPEPEPKSELAAEPPRAPPVPFARCSAKEDDVHARMVIEDEGLALTVLEGAGCAAVGCPVPFPPQGAHSVTLRVLRATQEMAVGVVASVVGMGAPDGRGWLGAAPADAAGANTAMCLWNGGALCNSGKHVLALEPGIISDGSTVVVSHKLGQVMFTVDGDEFVLRGARPPIHLCVCDGPAGGLEVRLERRVPGEEVSGSGSDDDDGGSGSASEYDDYSDGPDAGSDGSYAGEFSDEYDDYYA